MSIQESCVTSEVLGQLVEHYSQEIHNDFEERAPYFDALLGRTNVEIPTVLSYWLDRLKHSQSHCIHLLLGYSKFIRPCLINATVASVHVLVHYELLLSQCLLPTVGTKEYLLSLSDFHELSHQTSLLATDITAMTSASYFQCKKYVLCNIAIPTMIRILHHSFTIVSKEKGDSMAFSDRDTLSKCAVALLCFDTDRKLDPSVLAPSLFQSEQHNFQAVCAYPPENRTNCNLTHYLSLSPIDWSSLMLHGVSWNDLETGILSRAAETVWADLLSLLIKDSDSTPNKNEKYKIRQNVIRALGMGPVSRAVRSHFFGRDNYIWNSEKKESTSVVIMGKRVTTSEAVLKDKPHKTVPSRVHAALSFCSYLFELDVLTCTELVRNVLPICLELIDDSSSMVQSALGTCALIRLLDCAPTNSLWIELTDQIMPVLDLAFATTNRNGPTLILTGQAQSRLFKISRKHDQKRRQVTRKWLTLLRQSIDGSGFEVTSWDILVGGVIPLLYQHAKLPNADALELGRLGIAALLPLIDIDLVDTKSYVASCVALINLFVGAHPMMKNHSCKILSQLCCAAAILDGQSVNEGEFQSAKDLTLHTAAVALIVCGGPNGLAGQFLDEITGTNSEDYQDILLEIISDVRQLASCLTTS